MHCRTYNHSNYCGVLGQKKRLWKEGVGQGMWKWFKRLFREKDKPLSALEIRSGRGKNIIYPVDHLAEQHLKECLDDIFQKHHG